MSFDSDSCDEGAIDDLLNQAMDHSVLEQIAKINCSSFSSESVLPNQLEKRFNKLKSFPISKNCNSHFGGKIEPKNEFEQKPVWETEISEKGKGIRKKLGSGSVSSPSNSSNSSIGSAISSPLGEHSGKKAVKATSRTNLSDFSPSPPKKSGCLWCSPKWDSGEKSKGQRGIGYSEEFVSDLAKKQQKLLDKALKEEDKINREAEKIVKLAKLGSARMKHF